MAKNLLDKICQKFHNNVKKEAAQNIGVKQACYQHYVNGRPVKDWMIINIRRLYGRKTNNNGLTDTEILDELEKDYSINKLKEIIDVYK